MEEEPQMRWRVLHLKPRSEKRVAEVCHCHGIEHYLPLRQSIRIYPKRKALFTVPLFPGYLFVNYSHEQRPLLYRTNHIVRILEPDNQFRLLRQLVQVRRLLANDPELETVDPLACGDLVRIRSGPLAGFEGIVTRLRNRPGKRLVVLNIDIVGRAVAAETEANTLERLAKAE